MKKIALFVMFVLGAEITTSSPTLTSSAKVGAQQIAIIFNKVSAGFKRDLASAD